MIRKILAFIRSYYDWLALALFLIIIGLYVTGSQLFGFSGVLSTVMALIGGLVTAIISFLLATLVLPLIALVTGFIAALLAAFTGLLAVLVGGIFTPLAALLTGWLTTLIGWISATWLGTLLSPLYSVLSPVILKITPWITTSKYAMKGYHTVRQRLMKNSGNHKQPPQPPNP